MSRNWLVVVLAVLGSLLLTYSGYRAHELSFTYDESSTLLEYVGKSYAHIISRAPTANNHVLNTILIKALSGFLPTHEFTYRLPNLLAHAMYILFSVQLLFRLYPNRSYLVLFGFIILNLNPYLIDFFSLARGYGLAAGFTLATLYFLVRWLEAKKLKWLVLCLATSILAVLSNFSLLNLFLALVSLVSAHLLLRAKGKTRQLVAIICSAILLAGLIYFPVSELISRQELFFGGDVGLWTNTIQSLLRKSVYGASENAFITAKVIVIISFVLCAFVGFRKLVLTRNPNSVSINLLALFGLILIGLQLQHWLFGTKFIMERTALFLIPIFLTLLVSSLSDFSGWSSKTALFTSFVLAVLFGSNAATAFNTNHVLDWKHEADSKAIMQSIARHETNMELYFGVEWPYSVTARFYSGYFNYPWLQIIELNGFDNKSVEPEELDLEWILNDSEPSRTGPFSIEQLTDRTMFVTYPERKIDSLLTLLDVKDGTAIFDEQFIDLYKEESVEDVHRSTWNLNISLWLRPVNGDKPPKVKLVLADDLGALRSNLCTKTSEDGWYRLQLNHRAIGTENSLAYIYVWNVENRMLESKDIRIETFTITKEARPSN